MMLLSRGIKKNSYKTHQTNQNESTGNAEGCTGHIRQWQTHTRIVISANPQGGGSQTSVYTSDSCA